MLWLWIFGSATEVVVVEVVLRSIEARWADIVRLPVLILGIWGVLWMLGQLAAYKVRPHLITADHLRIRNGSRTRVVVPLQSIANVRAAEHTYPGVVKSLHHDDDLLLVGVNLRTNLELVLDRPIALDTSQGTKTAERVGLWVDDPRAVTTQLKTSAVRGT